MLKATKMQNYHWCNMALHRIYLTLSEAFILTNSNIFLSLHNNVAYTPTIPASKCVAHAMGM